MMKTLTNVCGKQKNTGKRYINPWVKKKAYDKVHHDWMLRVYKWVGVQDEVIERISNLMEFQKARFEI